MFKVILLAHWNNNPQIDMLHYQSSNPPSLCSCSLKLCAELRSSWYKSIGFGMTRMWIEPTIFCTWGENSILYIIGDKEDINIVSSESNLFSSWYCYKIAHVVLNNNHLLVLIRYTFCAVFIHISITLINLYCFW
jgi:hypothetical protein